ncbi:MAG: hypothetical protein P4M11_09180 [Candidatus Pacebacteria bacterium]|nr:hypothetical protein [Candidatus Paceibacterota bacterium]
MIKDDVYLGQHIDFIDNWLHASMCDHWQDYDFFGNISHCQSFLYGSLTKGAYNVLMSYYVTGNQYLSSASTQTASALLNSNDWVSEQQMIRYVLLPEIQEYTSYFSNLSTDLISTTRSIKLIVILACLFGGVSLFFVLWLPYVYQLRTELLRTDSMLMLIPNDVIVKSKFLREIFEKKYAILQ